MQTKEPRRFILLSTLLSLSLIVGALFYTEHPVTLAVTIPGSGLEYKIVDDIQDVRTDDHIRGNPNGAVILIEYSDYTCYFCGIMRQVFRNLSNVYPDIAFVYRHRPRDEGASFEYAKGSECVALLNGEDAFWEFTDKVYENGVSTSEDIRHFAIEGGLSPIEYNRCLEKYTSVEERVRRDWDEANRVGIPGTPFIVVVHDHKIAGTLYALPYAAFEASLKNLVGEDALGRTR